LGVIATMVYGFVVLMTTLSEMHKINLFRASSAIILGLMLLAAFSFVLCRFLHFLL